MAKNIYASDAERQTARRVTRYAIGLNSQGKPYGRHPNFVNRGETQYVQARQRAMAQRHALKRKMDRYFRLAEINRASGLRVDGQPFRRRPQMRAWNHFRAQITTHAAVTL